MSNRKVFEMSFAIAGQLGSSFKHTFVSASSQIKGLKSDIKALNQQYKQGALSADEYRRANERLTSQLARAQQAQKRIDSTMKLGKNVGMKALGAVGTTAAVGLGGATIGAGLFLGSSIKKAMDYEAELATIQALTGSTNQQMADMNTLALKMGAATKFSALEAAQGIEELLKAGLDPATVKAGGLEAALNLATAGGLDLADAANIMANSLNGFRKDGLKAADAANILAGAANASSADVHTLEEGLAAVGPVADGIGVSFKEVNATLAAFSNNALKGSDAGTSLKTFLQNVQPQTKQATALFEKYGLMTAKGTNILFDANGQLKDMADVAEILHKNFGKLNDQQRSDVFFKMFGSDSIRAANILFKEGAAGIKDMYKQMANVTALDVAKKKMDTAAGAVEQFKGAIETLQISALMPTMPLLKDFANGAADFVTQYTPQITKAMQDMSNSAKSYLKSHFIDNPDFQKLPDFSSKVKFVFDDIKNNFDDWLDKGGQQKINDVGSQTIDILAKALVFSTPQIVSAGEDIGNALALGVFSAFEKNLEDHPWMEEVINLSPMGATYRYLKGKVVDMQQKADQNRLENDPQLNSTNWHGPRNANGSNYFAGGLSLVGEQGPEIVNLPRGSQIFSNQKSLAMLQSAGRGGDVHNYTINFNPTVSGGNTAEIKQVLEDEREKFKRMMKDFLGQKGRVSFG